MSNSRSTEEIQYEKLTSFFEKLVGSVEKYIKWSLIIFGLLITVFGIVFFQDRQSMQAEKTSILQEKAAIQVSYNQKIESLVKEMEDFKKKNRETIIETKVDVTDEVESFKNTANGTILNLKNNANKEISAIKFSANELALKETAKQVANVFKEDKIQKIIENKAMDAIQEKIPDIVSTQLRNQAEGILKLASWESTFRTGSYYENEEQLKNFNVWLDKEFKDSKDRQKVLQLKYKIENEYFKEAVSKVFSLDLENLYKYDNDIPEKATKKMVVGIIETKINFNRENLHTRCERIQLLNRLLGTSYNCFDSFRPY